MTYDINVNGYRVRGDYTPARANYGRGEPSDTPPEPSQFDVELVWFNGQQVTDTLTPDELADLANCALIQIECEGYG